MFVIAVALTAFGAVGAGAAAVREAPRFARWYFRATHVVVTRGERTVGVVSGRDVLGVMSGNGRTARAGWAVRPYPACAAPADDEADRARRIREAAVKIKDVMTTEVLTVQADTPFKDVVDLLIEHRVSGVPVVDDDGRVLGLVTEADLMSKEAFDLRHRRPLAAVTELISGAGRWAAKARGLTAGDVMTDRVLVVGPGDDVRTAARRMLDEGVKRFPVVEDGRLVGIVARQDLLRIFHRPDADISAELAAKMVNPLYAPEDHLVNAVVTDGVVSLTGSVRCSGEVPVLVGLASNVAGVVHVVSRITYDLADGG